MPIATEKELTYDQMKDKERKGFKCSCGATVSVAYGGAFGISSYILRCTRDVNHTGLAREANLSAWDTPDELNIGNMSRIRRRKLTTELGEQKGSALAIYAGKGQLTIPEAREIITTIWPGAPEVEVKKAAIVCQIYGLNPLMKHLFLIPFNTKKGDKWETSYSMVLGIKASRIIARRKGAYSYLDDTPRIMTPDEQVKIFGEVDTANICAITRLSDPRGNTSIGTGKWPKATEVKGIDKGNSKLNMAMIRSERQALERLFPDSMPSEATDTVDERYQDLADGTKVEVSTGEIISDTSQATTPPPEAKQEASEGVFTEEPSPTVKDESPVTVEQTSEITKLLKDAGLTLQELGMYIKKERKDWTINKLADLKVWQFLELKEYLLKASGAK